MLKAINSLTPQLMTACWWCGRADEIWELLHSGILGGRCLYFFIIIDLRCFIYQQLVLYFCYPTNSLCMKWVAYFFIIFNSLLTLFSYCGGTAHCTDPPEMGPCRAHFTRWYYDPLNKKCHHFIFGGCDGNENNFETTDKCMSNCSGVTGMKSAHV